jgi:hypothetical protein
MLSDPLHTGRPGTTESVAYVHSYPAVVIDPGSIAGRSVRSTVVAPGSESFPATITIQRSKTKESKPVGTVRTSVRLDASLELADYTVYPFVQIILGVPNVEHVTEATSMKALIDDMCKRLTSLILFGPGEEDAVPTVAQGQVFRYRLLAGEA